MSDKKQNDVNVEQEGRRKKGREKLLTDVSVTKSGCGLGLQVNDE